MAREHPEMKRRLLFGVPGTNSQPRPPALDWQLQRPVNLREYNGLAWYGDEDISHVWAAYTGTWEDDFDPQDPNTPVDHKGVIWSSLIDWTP